MRFDPSEYPFGSHPRGAPSLHRRSALSGLAALALSPFGNACGCGSSFRVADEEEVSAV